LTPFAAVVTATNAFRNCLDLAAAAALAALTLIGCDRENQAPGAAQAPTVTPELGPIAAIERPSPLDPARVELGRKLFGDRGLSGNGKLACSGCHDLSHGGADHVALSLGVTGEPVAVNTPTVFNASLNFRQFWDGRATTLEEQIDGPLLNAHEMGSTWPAALAAVRSNRQLANAFAASYPDGVSVENVKDALATFERSLVTPDAPFDRFLGGQVGALCGEARHGYDLFTSYGCVSCHQGRGVGGNMFQKLGVMADYFADRGHETAADQGRFNVTHDEADRHVFKVPSLRNVARTAPYLHDGSLGTLDETVRVMARYQLGRDLAPGDVSALIAFLESLTGVYAGRPL
jgi:cytochrome c peroxidase